MASGRYRALREPREMKGGVWRVTGRDTTLPPSAVAEKVRNALDSSFIGSTGLRLRVHDEAGNYLDAVDIPKTASQGRIQRILREFGDELYVEADRVGEYYDYDA